MSSTSPAIDVIGTDRCTGCSACADSCARQAISIKNDAQGFYRPVVDRTVCNYCGLCSRHCPVIAGPAFAGSKEDTTSVWGGWSNNNQIRTSSTSGGIAYELARHTIDQHGIVVACVMDADLKPRHRIIDSIGDLPATQGSKYLPSRAEGVYEAAANEAKAGRKVLFIGTPCQVAAFSTFLKPQFRENVITADIICYGVPSVLPWERHIKETFDGQLRNVDFRFKERGWQGSCMRYVLQDGSVRLQSPADDLFCTGFFSTAFHQRACHSCPFARLPRPGDVTLGDFWGVPKQWEDQRGVSLILGSSRRGAAAIRELETASRVTLFESTIEIAQAKNPRLVSNRPIELPHPRRDEILNRLQTGESLKSIARVYTGHPVKRLAKRLMPSSLRAVVRRMKHAGH